MSWHLVTNVQHEVPTSNRVHPSCLCSYWLSTPTGTSRQVGEEMDIDQSMGQRPGKRVYRQGKYTPSLP